MEDVDVQSSSELYDLLSAVYMALAVKPLLAVKHPILPAVSLALSPLANYVPLMFSS